MPAATATIVPVVGNDAQWRDYVNVVRNAFLLAGWTQTADTGQIDPATAIAPASGTIYQYLVFAMNDAQQAAAPVIVKVELGRSAASASAYPRIGVSVGAGSDGAGNLTGVQNLVPGTSTNYIDWQPSVSADATPRTAYTSGDGSRLTFIVWFGGSYRGALNIERTRDADGTPNADGAMVWLNGGLNTYRFGLWTRDGNTVGWRNAWDTGHPRGANSQQIGNYTPVTVLSATYGRSMNPGVGLLAASASDFANGSTVQVTPYGTELPYVMHAQHTGVAGDNTIALLGCYT